MAHHLEAIYEQGILRPLKPLALAENQRVYLTLEESPVLPERETAEPINERREELRWLASESAPYAGEWVALNGRSLIAHGLKLADVISAAKAIGVTSPLFATVPRDQDAPFAGW